MISPVVSWQTITDCVQPRTTSQLAVVLYRNYAYVDCLFYAYARIWQIAPIVETAGICTQLMRDKGIVTRASLCRILFYAQETTINVHVPTEFKVSISTYYKDMKGDTKCGKWGGLLSQGSLKVTENSTIRQSAYTSYPPL